MTFLILYFSLSHFDIQIRWVQLTYLSKLFGGRYQCIEVHRSDFLADQVENSSFYVCLKKVDNWPIVHQMRQRMEFHFNTTNIFRVYSNSLTWTSKLSKKQTCFCKKQAMLFINIKFVNSFKSWREKSSK